MLYLLLLLCIHGAVAANCGQSSRTHTTVWLETVNRSDLFLPNTYLRSDDLDVMCRPLNSVRAEYIHALMTANVSCVGPYCIDGQFRCGRGSNECYHVEHIIDRKCSGFDGLEMNIMPNLIMAYGRWNQQVGRLSWDAVEAEKRSVYGDEIVDTAIRYIRLCHNRSTFGGAIVFDIVIVAFFVVAIVLLMVAVVVIKMCEYRTEE